MTKTKERPIKNEAQEDFRRILLKNLRSLIKRKRAEGIMSMGVENIRMIIETPQHHPYGSLANPQWFLTQELDVIIKKLTPQERQFILAKAN